MSYKGYKTQRGFYNAKCHALAVLLVGEEYAEECLHNEVSRLIHNRKLSNAINSPQPPDLPAASSYQTNTSGQVSIKDLTDTEVKGLYFMLMKSVKGVKSNERTVRELLKNSNKMTDDQRKKIIKITKYTFRWEIGTTFTKILEYVPRLRNRLTPFDIQKTKIKPLFDLMNKTEADKVIKRLERIEIKNEKLPDKSGCNQKVKNYPINRDAIKK